MSPSDTRPGGDKQLMVYTGDALNILHNLSDYIRRNLYAVNS